ncbi:MAG: phage tail sheath subtilisin-like domain-containing protein, partial [Pseudomonadales bacterium]
LGGERVPVGINHGDTANLVATSIAAAISAGADLPVTASVSDNVVTVTARHKGEVFNGYDLRASYYNEQLPAGLSLSFASLSGGSGNPDIQDTLDMLGDTWFNWGINPYTDTANLVTLEAELLDRWGPMRQIGCRMFSAIAGSHGTATTFGSSRNSHLISCLGLGASPTPAFIAAAINGAVAAGSLSIDPARPLQELRLPGLLAPISSEQWIRQERNLALYDGISTYTVERDGTCRIDRQITMYQTNASGYGDASYLDITTPETLERIRFEQLAMRAQKFPRHKLADDGTNFGEGQAIVTPKVWRGELLALYKFMETTRGWVEDYKTYEKSLLVERPTYDRNRLNWRDNPNLVNGAIVLAGQNQFIV